MLKPAALVSLAFYITLAAGQAVASVPIPASSGKPALEPRTRTRTPSLSVSPKAGPSANSTTSNHLFPVNDEKGLLLSCNAPEIETNSNTDVFENCTLAPGRTLDDVMHSFVGALHYVQNHQAKEPAGSQGTAEEKPAPAQK